MLDSAATFLTDPPYVMTSRVEETVERYAQDIIPQFEPVAVA
jgi:hypothetical protein